MALALVRLRWSESCRIFPHKLKFGALSMT
jgi:hypothetical protein